MNLGEIIWPPRAEDAAAKLLAFYAQELQTAAIVFPPAFPDPVDLTRRHLAGELSAEDLVAAREPWSRIVEAGGMRGPATREQAEARLALMVLSVTVDQAETFVDHLDWFLQFLHAAGVKSKDSISRMEAHFRSEVEP